ncbi:MAG: tetratricopeptide repeat protein, partial [Pseudomonadota bacterium]
MMGHRLLVTLVAAVLVASCASGKRSASDEPTLKSLEDRKLAIDTDGRVAGGREKAIAGYRAFVRTAPQDPRRPEALRRLGDLELQSSEDRALDGGADSARTALGAADYRNATKLYEDLLRAYPNYSGNDRVLYQLSKAQEQGGDLNAALASLTRLVNDYPNTPHRNEAQFRRGELLFTVQDYRGAEAAYRDIIASGDGSTYYERALYMRGWSLFKLGRQEEALESLFTVLDRRLIGRDLGLATEEIPALSRAERELVDDTFRVMSLSLANLNGAESLPPYFEKPTRREYEFRVYGALGDLYLKQDRIKDAAETYNSFGRRHPTHLQAPLLQVRAIEAYQGAQFATPALEAKKEFVTRYGVTSDYRRVNKPADYERVMPYVKKHLDELARHYHAQAQKTKSSASYQEAAGWYRIYLTSFPNDPQAAQMNF